MRDTQAISRVPAFMPAALFASKVGTWEYDVAADVMRGDAILAEHFNLNAEDAEAGLPSRVFLAAAHPEDNARADPMRTMVRTHGGVLVFELRVMDNNELVRWLLIRGAYNQDANGQMKGRGIAIDVTGGKLDGNLDHHLLFAASPRPPVPALEEAVDHAIAAHYAIESVDDRHRGPLTQAVRRLLYLLGCALAQGRLHS